MLLPLQSVQATLLSSLRTDFSPTNEWQVQADAKPLESGLHTRSHACFTPTEHGNDVLLQTPLKIASKTMQKL